MHKARAFFFVCAGLLCLALAYHLGARSAGAQGGGAGYDCIQFDDGVAFAVIGGYSYAAWDGGRLDCVPVPVPGRAVACRGEQVVLDNGQYWEFQIDRWRLVNTLPFSGPTPAAQPTWGQVKAKYAAPKGAVRSTQDLKGR